MRNFVRFAGPFFSPAIVFAQAPPPAQQPAASPQAPTWSPSQDIGMFVFGKSGPDR